jgi:hypothetical protein
MNSRSTIITTMAALLIAGSANAAVQEQKAVRTIIGEAANQGERGMICVAEVIRRRGSVRGFYGYRAKHVDQQPAWVWKQARRAWKRSAKTNYTRGATLFDNIQAFGQPRWAKKSVKVYKWRDHTFYKEVKHA